MQPIASDKLQEYPAIAVLECGEKVVLNADEANRVRSGEVRQVACPVCEREESIAIEVDVDGPRMA